MVLTMVALVALIGIVGLAIDFGFAYDYKQRAQIAADAAAIAAALDPDDFKNAGRELAKANEFLHVPDGNEEDDCQNYNRQQVCINHPPKEGDYAGDNNYYEAVIMQPHPTFLLGIVGTNTLGIKARAVSIAGGGCGSGSVTCVQVGSVEIKNSRQLRAEQCNLYFNSSLKCDGQLLANLVEVYTTASVDDDGCNYKGIAQEASRVDVRPESPPFPTCDEICSLRVSKGLTPCDPPHTSEFKCTNTSTIKPGCYNKGISVEPGGGKQCTFAPGDFYIKGKFEIKKTSGSVADIEGSSFYIENGGDNAYVNIAEGVKMNMVTRKGGDYNDEILFYLKPGAGQEFHITDGSRTDLTGKIIAMGAYFESDGNTYFYPAGGGGAGVSDECLLVE